MGFLSVQMGVSESCAFSWTFLLLSACPVQLQDERVFLSFYVSFCYIFNEWMNENLATVVKDNNRTVTYTYSEREISFLQWNKTGQASCSGVIDRYIMDSTTSLCPFIWLRLFSLLLFVCLFVFLLGCSCILFSWFGEGLLFWFFF